MNATLLADALSPSKPIFLRFLWKEYRMLRGFWLAVAGLAVLVQVVLPLLAFDERMIAAQLFAVAWGAAALYAVGAAITLFSAEREEETHGFLLQHTNQWWPMLGAKLLLAVISSLALALALSVSGAVLAGGWPNPNAVNETLGVAGVAVLEAIAWGLLFSLLMRQPLLAAILAMAAASFGAQLAVAASARYSDAFTSAAYVKAVPWRLLIAAAVLLVDVRLAARWLQPEAADHAASRLRGARTKRRTIAAAAKLQASGKVSRRALASRLLWQTWRESWPTMLAALGLSILLMFAAQMTVWLAGASELAILICPLILPALFGALVFRSDQRADHRQFLVAHGGRARWIWLARNAVWLTGLMLVGIVAQIAAIIMSWYAFSPDHGNQFYYGSDYGPLQSVWSSVWYLTSGVSQLTHFFSVGWCASFAAYGLGQLCSMLLRREVLAGFLALLLATVVSGWAAVVGTWQLSPAWFLGLIGAAALLATWLRAPEWLLALRQLRGWVWPAVALLVPLFLVFALVPSTRLGQLDFRLGKDLIAFLQLPLDESVARWEQTETAALATGTNYERLYSEMVPWREATLGMRIEGKTQWEWESEFREEEAASRGEPEDHWRMQQKKRALYKRFANANYAAMAAANRQQLEQLEQLSQRTEVHFSSSSSPKAMSQSEVVEILIPTEVSEAIRLTDEGELDQALRRLLTATRMAGQRYARQPYWSYRGEELSESISPGFLQWAQHPDQMSEQLKKAILMLQSHLQTYPPPREAVLADYFRVRDILLGKEPPSFLHPESKQSRGAANYLPYLANELPWERERALRALKLLTNINLNWADAVEQAAQGQGLWNLQNGFPYDMKSLLWRDWSDSANLHFEPLSHGEWYNYQRMQEIDARSRTSLLTAEELARQQTVADYLRTWVDEQVSQRGLLLQLALIAYRLDYGEYPEKLDALTPEYLPWVLLDPYSKRPFEYRPEGLEKPLVGTVYRFHQTIAYEISAYTPLVWNRGLHDCELVLEQREPERNAENNWEAQPTPGEMLYKFRASDWPWYESQNQAFALPRIED